MKNKHLILLFIPFVLCGCAKTSELYVGNAYDTGNFETNFYSEHEDIDKVNINNVYEVNTNGNHYISNPSYGQEIKGLKDDDKVNKDGKNYEWRFDTPIDDAEKGYGPSNNLTSIDNAFAYGFLSRLYDGRVRCDGYYANSRVQIDKSGYGTFFPRQMVTSKYFAISLRGQTSCEGFVNASTNIDVNVKFYKKLATNAYDVFSITMNEVNIPSNTGGEASLLLFYFNDVLLQPGISLINEFTDIVGMEVFFTLNDIISSNPNDKATYGVPSDDRHTENNPHFSLMIYEVLLPKSTWR